MKKPVIVIDLDNVLAESAQGFVAFSNSQFGTSLVMDDYNEHWMTMWGVSHEEAERRGEIMRLHQIQRDYKPKAGAKEILLVLKEHFELIILTSRRKQEETYTRVWLEQYYPGIFNEIVFSGFFEAASVKDGHLLTKGQQHKKLGASYVIDDHLKHCESAAQVDIHAILFGDYPWNKAETLPDKVTRCTDWKEVKKYFDAL